MDTSLLGDINPEESNIIATDTEAVIDYLFKKEVNIMPKLSETEQKELNNSLISASEAGHTETVNELLDAGADIKAVNIAGMTALIYASTKGHTKIVRSLIKAGADLDAANKYGMTALIGASEAGHTETVKELLDAGAGIKAVNITGMTALISASEKGHTKIVRNLIKAGADLDVADEHGTTALIRASEGGHTETVKELLDAGAGIKAVNIHTGMTALMIADRYNYPDTATLLRKHQARLGEIAECIKSRSKIDEHGNVSFNAARLSEEEASLLKDARRFNKNNLQEALEISGASEGQARKMIGEVRDYTPFDRMRSMSTKNQETGKDKIRLNRDVLGHIFTYLSPEERGSLRDAVTSQPSRIESVAVAGGGSLTTEAAAIGAKISHTKTDINDHRNPPASPKGDKGRNSF